MNRRSRRILQRDTTIDARHTWDFFSGFSGEIRNLVYGFIVTQSSKVPIRKRAFTNSVLTVAGVVKPSSVKSVANDLFSFKTQLPYASKQAWNELYARLKEYTRSADATLTVTITDFNFSDPIALYDLIMKKDKPPDDKVHGHQYGIMAKVLIRLNITADFAPFVEGALESMQKWFNVIDRAGDKEVDYEIGKLGHIGEVQDFLENLHHVFEDHEEASKISGVIKTWLSKRQSTVEGKSHLIGFYEPIGSAARSDDEYSEDEADQDYSSDAMDEDFEPDEAEGEDSDLDMEFDDGEGDDDMEPSLEDLQDLDAEMPDIRHEGYSASVDRGLDPSAFMGSALLSTHLDDNFYKTACSTKPLLLRLTDILTHRVCLWTGHTTHAESFAWSTSQDYMPRLAAVSDFL